MCEDIEDIAKILAKILKILGASGITRFHQLKFKIFIFCDIQFRSARVY